MNLEKPCERCGGEGFTKEFGNYEYHKLTCNACGGLGFVVTEEGGALLEFLKRRFKMRISVGD